MRTLSATRSAYLGVFDVFASAIAFLVLRRMRVPEGGTRPSVAQAGRSTAPVGAD